MRRIGHNRYNMVLHANDPFNCMLSLVKYSVPIINLIRNYFILFAFSFDVAMV